MKKKKINWQLFAGSTHCEEGLAMFALGLIKTFKDFEHWFYPYMKEQGIEVRKMRGQGGIEIMRQRASRAYKRITGSTPVKDYNPIRIGGRWLL